MHPQWQKQYLHNILTVLPQIFKDKKLQFILTSHSPFLVSDLPKDHIIFLEKGEDGTCKVKNSLNEMKQTFGANIHTLLTDSFFMTGGLLGEFAKEKINGVIDRLQHIKSLNDLKKDEKGHEWEKEYIWKVINAVGEPIIKNQLIKMYQQKQVYSVEEEIKTLKARLDELEKGKN
jgi:predicted ATP-binding protein involved in virulence